MLKFKNELKDNDIIQITDGDTFEPMAIRISDLKKILIPVVEKIIEESKKKKPMPIR